MIETAYHNRRYGVESWPVILASSAFTYIVELLQIHLPFCKWRNSKMQVSSNIEDLKVLA